MHHLRLHDSTTLPHKYIAHATRTHTRTRTRLPSTGPGPALHQVGHPSFPLPTTQHPPTAQTPCGRGTVTQASLQHPLTLGTQALTSLARHRTLLGYKCVSSAPAAHAPPEEAVLLQSLLRHTHPRLARAVWRAHSPTRRRHGLSPRLAHVRRPAAC